MEREALHKAAIKFSLDLHPSATADVMEGVRDQLNAVLLRYQFCAATHISTACFAVRKRELHFCSCRYSTYLEGVLISYTQPRILSQQVGVWHSVVAHMI